VFIGLAAQTPVSTVSFLSIPCNGSHEIDDNRWPDIVFWDPYVYISREDDAKVLSGIFCSKLLSFQK